MKESIEEISIWLDVLSRRADHLAMARSICTTYGAKILLDAPSSMSPELQIFQSALLELHQTTQLRMEVKKDRYRYTQRYFRRAQKWLRAQPVAEKDEIEAQRERACMLSMNAFEKYMLNQSETLPLALLAYVPHASSKTNSSFRLRTAHSLLGEAPAVVCNGLTIDFAWRWRKSHYQDHDGDWERSFCTDNHAPYKPNNPENPWPDLHFSWLLWTIFESPSVYMSNLFALPWADHLQHYSLCHEIVFDKVIVPKATSLWQERVFLRAALRVAVNDLKVCLESLRQEATAIDASSRYLLSCPELVTELTPGLCNHLKSLGRLGRNRLRHVRKAIVALAAWENTWADQHSSRPLPASNENTLQNRALHIRQQIQDEGEHWKQALQWIKNHYAFDGAAPVIKVGICYQLPEFLEDLDCDETLELEWDGERDLLDLLAAADWPWISSVEFRIPWATSTQVAWQTLSSTSIEAGNKEFF